MTIEVNDIDEVKPVYTSGLTALNIDENILLDDDGGSVVVYKAIVDDSEDAGEDNQITFSLSADSDSIFTIDDSTGVVTLDGKPDYESSIDNNGYSFVVIATDSQGRDQFSDPISVSINNLDEVAPEITSGNSAGSIAENSGTNQVVYTATANDVHANEAKSDGFTFALEGTDAGAFTIDAVSGEVRLIDNADQDDKSQYSFSVIATDAAGNASDAEDVTLNITPESQIVVAHAGINNGHIEGVRVKVGDVVKGVSNGRDSTAIDVDIHKDDQEDISTITLEKDIEATDVANVVNSADALMVLRMAVGIDKRDTSNSADYAKYEYESSLDFNADGILDDYDLKQMAANVFVEDGDGRITSRDALEILKISVRMDDALESAWMFAQNETDTVQDTMTFKGFIRGDVNNSWNRSDESAERINKAPEITTDEAIVVQSTAEVGDVIYKVAADDDNYEVSYSMADVVGLSFDVNTGVVTLTDTSVLSSSSFAFTITATDNESVAETDSITVVATVDEIDTTAPTITKDSVFNGQIDEGVVDNEVVFKASSEDGVTFTLGAGSDPALSVNDQGEVILSNAADEDVQSEYHFMLIATDAAGNETKEKHVIEVAARDEVAPTIVSGNSAKSVDENSSSGDVIYTAKATDSDHHGEETIGFELKDQPAGLSINVVTGEVTLNDAVDYEGQDEITFTVIAYDSLITDSEGNQIVDPKGNKTEKVVTIAVNDVDEVAPIIESGSTALSIDEDTGAGQVVYTVEANDIHVDTDSNGNEIVVESKTGDVTYSLSGDDAALFTIDEKSGEVRLNANPDYEKQPAYSFTVEASDGKNELATQTVTLSINDIDEVAPTLELKDKDGNLVTPNANQDKEVSITENTGSGQTVYTVSKSDNFVGEVMLTLSADSDSALTLDADGNIILNDNPDHEMQREYNFTVIATDSAGNSSPGSATIIVNDVDDAAPRFDSVASASLVEGAHNDKVIYRAQADDEADSESTAQLDYSILVGKGSEQEVIAGTQLVYVGSDTVQRGNEIDVAVNYLADSSGLTGLGLKVHYDSSKLSFVGMDDLAGSVIFHSEDFVDEANPSASFVSVAWADVNGNWTGGELPELLLNAKFAVIATEATTAEISFSSNGTALNYDFASVNHELKLSPVSIDSDGDVKLNGDINYESSDELSFTVIAKDDSGFETTDDVVIAVENMDEKAPVIDSSNDAGVIVENSGAGQLIYTATSHDNDDISQSNATYSLQNHDSSLIINSKTGDVYLLANPDYDSASGGSDTITFTVVVEDATGPSSKDVTLTVANLDELAPTFLAPTEGASNVDENASGSQHVYTAAAVNDTDTDGVTDDSVSYSLASNSDGAFSINPDSGEVSFNEVANYEEKSSYSFTVEATDVSGESSSESVTIMINNLDEVAPVITSGNVADDLNDYIDDDGDLVEVDGQIDENHESDDSVVVYTVSANDVHYDVDGNPVELAEGGLTYSLSGADAALFEITDGVVTLEESPDFETQSSYSFDIVATDDAGNASAVETVTLTVNNIDEIKPEITSGDSADAVFASNQAAVIYTASATDSGDDSNGNITYSVIGNSDVDIVSNEVTVNEGASLSSSVDFTIVATDDAGNSSEQEVSIPVVSYIGTMSPTTTAVETDNGDINNAISYSYTNAPDVVRDVLDAEGNPVVETVQRTTLKLSINEIDGVDLSNIDFELSSTSTPIDATSLTVASEPTMHIATQEGDYAIRVSQVYMNNYDANTGAAILEYTFDTPTGGNVVDFKVSSILIGEADNVANDVSSTFESVPNITGTEGNDSVILANGFATVDLGAGADTFIVAPDYNGDIVIDFASGEDSFDMTGVLGSADYSQVSGSTPDIADLISNSDESLDNAFGGYFNDETDVLTLFVDADSNAGVTDVVSTEVALSVDSDFNDDDLSVNFDHFGSLVS